MVNKTLFKTDSGPAVNTINKAGGTAYTMKPEHALAQLAVTGTLHDTFYTAAADQLMDVVQLANAVDVNFLAKLAIYSRKDGKMKDMPALFMAVLSTRDTELMKQTFHTVIDNGRMLRNFVQVMRSGVVGRKSLGSAPKRLVNEYLLRRPTDRIFKDTVGNTPSLTDIIKMTHPNPITKEQEALFGYLIGREYDARKLPQLVKEFEAYKLTRSGEVPAVPFQMLTALNLDNEAWTSIAKKAPWQMTRMNINTFKRHGVFNNSEVTQMVADRLANPELVRKSRCFPYQLFTAYKSIERDTPMIIREALQDAMEVATENVPEFGGKVYVFVDVSGSMHTPVTGHRGSATTVTSCHEVASLIASCVLRNNKDAVVIPFNSRAYDVVLNPRDTIMTNTAKLSSLPAGGTNCSAPLRVLNAQKAKGDLIIYASDNESWMDSQGRNQNGPYGVCGCTETMTEWKKFKRRNKGAKMVCIDLAPSTSTQAVDTKDIMNIGGFSDKVFDVIADFVSGKSQETSETWVKAIKEVQIEAHQ